MAAPSDAPPNICLWDDGSLRIGSFRGKSGELIARATDILIRVQANRHNDFHYRVSKNSTIYTNRSSLVSNARDNRAAIKLKRVLGPHMSYPHERFIVLDPIGFELLKLLVTD